MRRAVAVAVAAAVAEDRAADRAAAPGAAVQVVAGMAAPAAAGAVAPVGMAARRQLERRLAGSGGCSWNNGWHGGSLEQRLARRFVEQRLAWRMVRRRLARTGLGMGLRRLVRRRLGRLLVAGGRRFRGLARLGLGNHVRRYFAYLRDQPDRSLDRRRLGAFLRASAAGGTGEQLLVLLRRSGRLLSVREIVQQVLDAGRSANQSRLAGRPAAIAMTVVRKTL